MIGVGSSGLHGCGLPVAAKALLSSRSVPLRGEVKALGCSLAEELLRPTRDYAPALAGLARSVPPAAVSPIGRGGLAGDALRGLPRGHGLAFVRGTWPVLPVFTLVRRLGRLPEAAMYRTFNMGLGLVLVVPPARVEEALKRLLDGGDRAHVVGRVTRSGRFALVG